MMFKQLTPHKQLLNSLTPAEVQFIFNNRETSSLQLARITLEDLYIKKYLQFIPVQIEGKNELEGEVRMYHRIKIIEKPDRQKLKPHEIVITDLLDALKKEVPLAYFVKLLFPSISYNKTYCFNNIYLELVRSGLFKRTFVLEKMDVFRLSRRGKYLSHFLKEFIPYCENSIDDWIDNNSDEIFDLINNLDTLILISDALYGKIVDIFYQDFQKKVSHRIDKLSKNHFSNYIRDYCSSTLKVVDFRDVEWQHAGLSSDFALQTNFDPFLLAMTEPTYMNDATSAIFYDGNNSQ
jgi:hypothetical protein